MSSTPGPWQRSGGRSLAIIDGKQDTHIADVRSPQSNCGPKTKAQSMANAVLIAAAPTLLSACEEALESLERLTPGIVIDAKDTLRLAIRKATVGS